MLSASLAAALAAAAGVVGVTATAAATDATTSDATSCYQAPAPTTNAAVLATPTASYTAAWNDVRAVNDGTVLHTDGSQDQIWGTYSGDRPAQQWLELDWETPRTLTSVGVAFWHDNPSATAGDGVAVPAAWTLEAWDEASGAWQPVEPAAGSEYGVAPDAMNSVELAAPVSTTSLRATFDATGDGTSYAAVAVSELEAHVGDEDAFVADDDQERLVSDSFHVGVSTATGGLYTLQNNADTPTCTNYTMNPDIHPAFDIDDSRWTGDVTLKVDGTPRVTGLSDDVRTVSREGDAVTVAYTGDAAHPNGIRGFDLDETYTLTDGGSALDWSITLDNTSGESVEVQDLAVPMLMNSWWNGGDQTGIYEQNVGRHSFVAQDGSYVYWQRPNGVGPFLVMTPNPGTSLEFRDKARTGEGPFGENDPAWEGLVELAIHSESLQPTRQGKIEGYLPPSSLTLPAGEAQTYGFSFRWADGYADLRDVLYEAGVVDVVSLPGMVVPQDTAATLAVRARDGIDEVVGEDGRDVSISPTGERNGYETYAVEFADQGPHQVTVRYAGGRESVLQYNSVAPVEELVDARARFLVDHQQARDTGRGYEGAFLQWDMSRERQITWHDYPGGGWKQWMAGGSDDLGLSPAAFLSEKNLLDPDQEQVSALDYYLEEFIWGYMQTQTDADGERTYRIYHWYDGTDGSSPGTADGLATWRVMNYPHVWNTYYAMYRIASTYPGVETALSADEYLLRAFRTMRAYFTHPNVGTLDDASREMGSMGEMTMPEIVDALSAEDYTAEAEELEGYIATKADEMLQREYPFASEMSIDTTAFEATYTLAKRYGDDEMVDKVTRASMASRGLQPLWYYYGSDNRHMGESWWNLGYETQLGAWQQQDFLLTDDAADAGLDPDEVMRSTYGAYLAGWSNINTGQISEQPVNHGAASWQFQSQQGAGEGQWGFMPMLDGWWAWSGEADLGFWGGLRTASVNVVDDSVVGPYAYGGEMTHDGGTFTIVPRDGVRQRLAMYNLDRLHLELEGATYSEAQVADDASDLRLAVEAVAPGASARLTLGNLPAGDYRVTVDGGDPRTVVSDGDRAVVDLDGLSGEGVVTVVDATAPATATPQVSVAQPDCEAGTSGSIAGVPVDGVERYVLKEWVDGQAGGHVAAGEVGPGTYVVRAWPADGTELQADGDWEAIFRGRTQLIVEIDACGPVVPAWDAEVVYRAGDRVVLDGAVFEATWWTQDEEPGASAHGSWQEIAETADGDAVWTPSRIFHADDVVVHDGERYAARWWTRNAEPGTTPWGPWEPTG
ncbi:DUF5695 domain-containing protein [Isoptericola sp. AK164]|uniref:DUF5695 domain-containing protein n=1 Tax=Isoptericola sp. AK164 TaxID=3024246 RepID=UPI002418A47D|nr:DUF5695 domain-containing protein [Isoptericola sp. AK164]